MHQYTAFNLAISSELAIPQLHSSQHSSADIHIRFGHVDTNGIQNPLQAGMCFQANLESYWLNVPSIARFLITHGREIKIDVSDNADEESLSAFILDIALSVALMQRNMFVLRGGIINRNSQGILFLATSGAGVSTLMAAFLKRGYPLLTDKLCALDASLNGLPGLGFIEVWQQVATALGYDSIKPVRPPINKWIIPAGKQYHSQPLPIKLIYILQFQSQVIDCKLLNGAQKIECLQQFIYRKNFRPLLNPNNYFQQCINIANRTEMIALNRPAIEYPLDQLVHFIEQDWQARGINA